MPGEYVATKGPAATGDLFVSVYLDQMHFTWHAKRTACWPHHAHRRRPPATATGLRVRGCDPAEAGNPVALPG